MPKKHGSGGLSASATAELFEYLDRFEAKLDHALSQIDRVKREQRSIAETEISLELENMAEFTNLLAEVTKIKDLTASIKAMNDGLKAERDALKTELDALKAADAVDQAAVDEAQAKLAEVTAALEALTAVVSNTPVGSTGGI